MLKWFLLCWKPSGDESLADEDWHTEMVNGSQFHVLKGLKKGLAYRVRVVARGHDDRAVHLSEVLLVKVPGEASSQPQGLVGYLTAAMHDGRCVEMLKRMKHVCMSCTSPSVLMMWVKCYCSLIEQHDCIP